MAGLLGQYETTFTRTNPALGLTQGLESGFNMGSRYALALRQQRMQEEELAQQKASKEEAMAIQNEANLIDSYNKMKNNPGMQKVLGQAIVNSMAKRGQLPPGTQYQHDENATDYFKALADLKKAYLDKGDIEGWKNGVDVTTSHFADEGSKVQAQAGNIEKQKAAELGSLATYPNQFEGQKEYSTPEAKQGIGNYQNALASQVMRLDPALADKLNKEFTDRGKAGEYKPPQPWGFTTTPDGRQVAVGFDPSSKKVVSYDMPFNGQVTPFSLGHTPAALITSGTMLDTIKGNLERINSNFDPKYVGFVTGRAKQLQANTVGGLPEAQTSFYADVNDIADMLLRARSGAQINEQEYQRLSRLVPTPNLPPDTFKSRLKRFETQVNQILTNQNRRLQGGGYQTVPSKTESTSFEQIAPAGVKAKLANGKIVTSDGKGGWK